MDNSGLFKNLPLLAFKRILYFLPLEDKKKTRHLSKWFEVKVTLIVSSVFNKFNIRFISTHYSLQVFSLFCQAMKKQHNQQKKFNLNFYDQLSPTLNSILTDYKENIISLAMLVIGTGEMFLLEPTLKFVLLAELSLKTDFMSNDSDARKIFESLIAKHASQLMSLTLQDQMFVDLTVPSLPKLETLSLNWVRPEVTRSLLLASANTIKTFKVCALDDDIEQTTAADTLASVCCIPNMIHLNMDRFNVFKLISVNAMNLVSLVLDTVFMDFPNNWPEFPNLRELELRGDYCLLPILSKCRSTLECLVFEGLPIKENDTYEFRTREIDAVVMPRLTDLFLYARFHEDFPVSCRKILSCNNKSIEFLSLCEVQPLFHLDNAVKMENVKTVLLESTWDIDYSDADRNRLAKLCPNADMITSDMYDHDELVEYANTRRKMKGFTVNTEKYYFSEPGY